MQQVNNIKEILFNFLTGSQYITIIGGMIALVTVLSWLYKIGIYIFYHIIKKKELDVSNLLLVTNLHELCNIYLWESTFWFKSGFLKTMICLINKKGFEKIEQIYHNNIQHNQYSVLEFLYMNMFIGKIYELTCIYKKSSYYYEKSFPIYEQSFQKQSLFFKKHYYSAFIMKTYVNNIIYFPQVENLITFLKEIKTTIDINDPIYIRACLLLSEISMNSGTAKAFNFSYECLIQSISKIKTNSRIHDRLKVLEGWNKFKYHENEEAIKILQPVIKKLNRKFINDKRLLSTAYMIISISYCESKKYNEAIKNMQNALDLIENTYHNYLKARIYGNFGMVLMNMNNKSLEMAKEYFEKAYCCFNEIFGEMHIDTAKSYGNKAQIHSLLNKTEDSNLLFSKHIEMYKKIFNDQPHVDLGKSYRWYGELLVKMDKKKEAYQQFKNSIDTFMGALENIREKQEEITKILKDCKNRKIKNDLKKYIQMEYPFIPLN